MTSLATSRDLSVAPRPANDAGRVLPRLLNAKEAAQYLGFETRDVLKSIPVKPIELSVTGSGSSKRWDRRAIDQWLNEKSGLLSRPALESGHDVAQAEFDAWLAAQ
ncbi:hypothetical protein [Caulobacter flavus]|uniref:hypothetical protein n=1 Tax=Caulobacter flavus TaxID=1679497 RepID=UPI0011AEC8AD|nr:hypothetical protein [Caulobacter flavus]